MATHKFMWRFLPVRIDRTSGKGSPLQVEIFDGEKEYISENVPTWWMKGPPVELPASPCLVTEWDEWMTEFARTHQRATENRIAENLRYSDSMCIIIRSDDE
jgi:hypothetical protein